MRRARRRVGFEARQLALGLCHPGPGQEALVDHGADVVEVVALEAGFAGRGEPQLSPQSTAGQHVRARLQGDGETATDDQPVSPEQRAALQALGYTDE